MDSRSHRVHQGAFTLVELVAAMSVLTILVVGVVQMLNSASTATTASKSRLEVDDQARLVLDCISQDFNQIVKQGNVDSYFRSAANLGTPSGKMFFYVGTPGYSAATATDLSGVSLTGYRINTTSTSANYNQLERYSSTALYDGSDTNSLTFLTYNPSATGNFGPLAASTIATATPMTSIVGPTSTDSNFHVLGTDVFRLEFCYQLRDGTYSSQPILSTKPSTWGTSTYYTSATSPPTLANGAVGSPTYVAGARWFDTNGQRGYYCMGEATNSASAVNQAVWGDIGWQDVSAVVITIAAMDINTRTFVKNTGQDYLKTLAGDLTSPTTAQLSTSTPTLASQLWLQALNSGTLSPAVPRKAIAAVRVYQRYMYLNAQ